MKNIQEILAKLHIDSLSDMQNDAMNVILHQNTDLVILSPTGSGKTYAYLLPLVQRLDSTSDAVQALVIVPGRELALQSANVLKDMGSDIRACACYGGRATMDEHRMLRQVMPQIVFATPGRLNDHLDKGNIDANNVKWLIIDEFDKCLEMGFLDEMKALLSKLPTHAHRILLSATDAESIPHFVNLHHVVRLDYLNEANQDNSRVDYFKVLSPQKDKLPTLSSLLRALGNERSIVFLNYRESVERTSSYLQQKGFVVSSFHGGLEQKEREDALYKFSNDSANILVSTNLASRGLDIPEIDNIIHYHLPEDENAYVHRVGRTARWKSHGKTYFLLSEGEQIPEYVHEDIAVYKLPDSLPAPAKPRMATLYIGKGKKDKISKGDIVGFLCKKGGLRNNQIGRIDVRDYYSYVAVERTSVLQVLRQVAGEKIKGIKTIVEEVR